METIEKLQKLRDRLQSQLRIIQSEFDAVDKTIKLYEREFPESPVKTQELRSLGMTDAVRRIVKGEYVTPLKVRDQLIQGGFPCPNGASNLLDTVWSTMRRLGTTSEYEAGKKDGKFVLRRRNMPKNASLTPQTEAMKTLQ